MTRTTARAWRLASGLLVVVAAGCGLSEYEAMMRGAQEQVARYDEEAEYLGDPLVVPKKKEIAKDGSAEKTVAIANLFLRGPRGIRTTPEEAPHGGVAYRYPKVVAAAGPRAAAPPTVPGPAAGKANPRAGATSLDFTDLYVAVGSDGDKLSKSILDAFSHKAEVLKSKRIVKVPNREAPLTFDVTEFGDEQADYALFVHTEGKLAVAILYRMASSKKLNLSVPIDLSLATLAIGPEADIVRTSYNRRPGKSGGGAAPAPGAAPPGGAGGGGAPILRGGG